MTRKYAKKEEQFRRGIAAEKFVAGILAKLPTTEYKIFNDVKARYGNIDHLVIRKDGATYIIETKSHQGKVTWDGNKLLLNGKPFEKDFIVQINRNIKWLRELIKKQTGTNIWIVAVLVFPNALIYSGYNKRVLRLRPVKWINVISAGFLTRLIESYIPKISRSEIWKIKEIFSHSSSRCNSSQLIRKTPLSKGDCSKSIIDFSCSSANSQGITGPN